MILGIGNDLVDSAGQEKIIGIQEIAVTTSRAAKALVQAVGRTLIRLKYQVIDRKEAVVRYKRRRSATNYRYIRLRY